jgi:crotonobetainyl-CoA:carnitine CoA-transferase CaiB-like acyl-CoA transferase
VRSDCCRVVSAEKDADGIEEVRRDAVRVVVGAEEPKYDPEFAKPGARHQRLKGELQQQIAQRRSEEWSRRLQERQLDNEEEGERTSLHIFFKVDNK